MIRCCQNKRHKVLFFSTNWGAPVLTILINCHAYSRYYCNNIDSMLPRYLGTYYSYNIGEYCIANTGINTCTRDKHVYVYVYSSSRVHARHGVLEWVPVHVYIPTRRYMLNAGILTPIAIDTYHGGTGTRVPVHLLEYTRVHVYSYRYRYQHDNLTVSDARVDR